MSDVREQLATLFAKEIMHTGKSPGEVADIIMERFDLNPKPVIGPEELGLMVSRAAGGYTETKAVVGRKMFDQLDAAGLVIRRAEDGQ